MNHGKKNINRKWIITAIVCTAVLVFGVIYLSATKLINLNPNFASPNKFVVADDFDVSINSTSIKYDEAASADNIFVNLTVKNNSDAAYHLISCFFINASQDSAKVLVEPDANVRSDGIENNTTALAQVVDTGETLDLLFAFRLSDYSDVRLSFTGFGLDNQPQEPIVVTLPVHKTINVWWNEICNWWDVLGKQNVDSVKVANFDIPLADGWYAETQGTVASVFKNPKFPSAQITMGAASSMQAKALAEQTAQMSNIKDPVQSFEINGKTYWGYTTDSGFVLCLDGEDGLVLRINAQNITLDAAQPLL